MHAQHATCAMLNFPTD